MLHLYRVNGNRTFFPQKHTALRAQSDNNRSLRQPPQPVCVSPYHVSVRHFNSGIKGCLCLIDNQAVCHLKHLQVHFLGRCSVKYSVYMILFGLLDDMFHHFRRYLQLENNNPAVPDKFVQSVDFTGCNIKIGTCNDGSIYSPILQGMNHAHTRGAAAPAYAGTVHTIVLQFFHQAVAKGIPSHLSHHNGVDSQLGALYGLVGAFSSAGVGYTVGGVCFPLKRHPLLLHNDIVVKAADDANVLSLAISHCPDPLIRLSCLCLLIQSHGCQFTLYYIHIYRKHYDKARSNILPECIHTADHQPYLQGL